MPILLALLAPLLWAIAIVLSKHALGEINSNQLFVIQIIAAMAAAWVVVWVRREKVAGGKRAWLAYSTGLFEPFLAYTLSLYGLAFVSAGIASLVYSTETLMIILLSVVLLKNKIESPLTFAGLILAATCGSVLAIYGDVGDVDAGVSGQKLIGYALIFAGVFFAALYVVVSAKLIVRHPPLILLTGQLSFCTLLAAIFIVPFADWQPLDTSTFLLAALSGILQYYLAFFCYLFSLQSLKIQIAGALLYLIPVFGIALSAVFLGERVTAMQLVGVAVVLLALLGIHFRHARD